MLEEIEKITLKEFRARPGDVRRMSNGTCNEVYAVNVNGIGYILRLNVEEKWLKGSSRYIPLFQSLGITVPNIIAENFSKGTTGYNYQILSLLPGTDLTNVIATLTDDELKSIAQEIARIAEKLRTLPTNRMYGFVGYEEEHLKPTWIDVLREMLQTIKLRAQKTGVVDSRNIRAFDEALAKYTTYLDRVPSEFYFDDMSSKNVIVACGRFVGLVDLDSVAYGDFLEGIGRIKASWYGTPHGALYTQAVEDALHLNDHQREIVTLYALLNRIF
jgi:aminoglycoside phosphotransferase (APT) family kinase protein